MRASDQKRTSSDSSIFARDKKSVSSRRRLTFHGIDRSVANYSSSAACPNSGFARCKF